jgi:hypothetical protein
MKDESRKQVARSRIAGILAICPVSDKRFLGVRRQAEGERGEAIIGPADKARKKAVFVTPAPISICPSSFLPELPRFENSRNVEVTISGKFDQGALRTSGMLPGGTSTF